MEFDQWKVSQEVSLDIYVKFTMVTIQGKFKNLQVHIIQKTRFQPFW